MRDLSGLIDQQEPALPLILHWIETAEIQCDVLPASDRRAEVLHRLQITTRSPLGALAYETGGLMIDGGWLRFLGSGHPRLSRDIATWNAGRSNGFLLVADDAVGGFFALNGGAFGPTVGSVYYWPPDDLTWQDLNLGFTDFLRGCLTSRLNDFYSTLRWPNWRHDVSGVSGDSCFTFYPFLWTVQGSLTGSRRSAIPVHEAFDFKTDSIRQIQE